MFSVFAFCTVSNSSFCFDCQRMFDKVFFKGEAHRWKTYNVQLCFALFTRSSKSTFTIDEMLRIPYESTTMTTTKREKEREREMNSINIQLFDEPFQRYILNQICSNISYKYSFLDTLIYALPSPITSHQFEWTSTSRTEWWIIINNKWNDRTKVSIWHRWFYQFRIVDELCHQYTLTLEFRAFRN